MSMPFLNKGPRQMRTVLALVVCGLVVSTALAVRPVGAAPPTPALEAAPALDWLSSELGANAGSLPGFTPGSTDWGLTADAVLAFVAAGRTSDPAVVAATDLLASNAAVYTTWAPDMPEVRVSGATAKVLLSVLSMGRGSTVAGVDLESELRALMVTEGSDLGRFADRVPDPSWDSSNGFAQSLAVLALAMTSAGVPEQATSFLLDQQCPAGGFRLNYLGGSSCSADTEADTDATAVAVQALLAAPRSVEVAVALERAIAWLLSQQSTDGSFGGTGPTAAANSNSTGLIAQALRAAGQAGPADRAATWIAQRTQLDAGTAEGTAAAAHVGAIAYNPAARDAALVEGITAQAADQWRRATTQAVLAFGLAPFGPRDVEPLPPVTTTTFPSTTTTAAPTTIPSTTTAPTTSSSPTMATPTPPPTISAPPPAVALSGLPDGAADVLDSSAINEPDTERSAASRMALTGKDTAPWATGAIALILMGAVLCLCGARRRA